MGHLNACILLPCYVTQEGDMLSTASCVRLCSAPAQMWLICQG